MKLNWLQTHWFMCCSLLPIHFQPFHYSLMIYTIDTNIKTKTSKYTQDNTSHQLCVNSHCVHIQWICVRLCMHIHRIFLFSRIGQVCDKSLVTNLTIRWNTVSSNVTDGWHAHFIPRIYWQDDFFLYISYIFYGWLLLARALLRYIQRIGDKKMNQKIDFLF